MIGIIDCNLGNVGSLLNAFAYLGAPAELIHAPENLAASEAVVLPGVGAFDAAMTSLNRSGFGDAVKAYVALGKPVLGVCLGLQVLCNASEEGTLPGLGLIDGEVRNLRNLGCHGKIPHVGFNSVADGNRNSPFLSAMTRQDFYFVHSFALQRLETGAKDAAVAFTDYEGSRFVAALQWKNVFATQFHPEKSGEAGLALLRAFLRCSRNA